MCVKSCVPRIAHDARRKSPTRRRHSINSLKMSVFKLIELFPAHGCDPSHSDPSTPYLAQYTVVLYPTLPSPSPKYSIPSLLPPPMFFSHLTTYSLLSFRLFIQSFLKVHKHEIFFLTFFAVTQSFWSQGPVTRDFWKYYLIRPRYSTFKPFRACSACDEISSQYAQHAMKLVPRMLSVQ